MVVEVIVWVLALLVVKLVVKTLQSEVLLQIKEPAVLVDNIIEVLEEIITMVEVVADAPDVTRVVSQHVQAIVTAHVVELVILVVEPVV